MSLLTERIIEMHKKGRLHHAFLFLGLDTELKARCVLDLAVYLLALEEKDPERKQKVASKIINLSHPDFYCLQSEAAQIKVDDVREFSKWAHRSPIENASKVLSIPEAERLNPAASNALLKILEEPPSYLTLFLSAPNESSMLKTITSRCFSVQFPNVHFFQEQEKEPPFWGQALEHILDLDQKVSAKEILDFSQSFSKDREELREFFFFLQKKLRQILQAHRDSSLFYHWETQYVQCLELESSIYHRYGNIQLGLENFLLHLRKPQL